MKDSHHTTRYNVEFNEYTADTGFGERALYPKYYKGLAPRLKDGLVYSGRRGTLAELQSHALALDLRYWECRKEDFFKPVRRDQQTSPTPELRALSSRVPRRFLTFVPADL